MNEYVTCDDFTFIFTSNGFTIVDTEDVPRIKAFKTWYIDSDGYAYSWYIGPGHRVRISRLILSFPDGKWVDHANGNRLDNTKQNLRIATPSDNNRNRKRSKKSKAIYRGVRNNTGKRGSSRYTAYIRFNTKNSKYLGSFSTPEQAAIAYDDAARKYHGIFATLNFPENINE